MTKITKTLMMVLMVLTVMMPIFTFVLSAPANALEENALWGNKYDDIKTGMGDVGNRDPREIAASVIRVLMGFLGIIAVVIILMGGFKWMTAGGNEEKVGEAKKLIAAGVIGLIIILAAFGIATFVINAILGATTGT